jgi:PAS domain S-box-containing protein
MPSNACGCLIQGPAGRVRENSSQGFPVLCETEQLIASLPSILISLTADLQVTRWNRMAERVLGVPADHVRGGAFIDTPIRWDWELVQEGLERCRRAADTVRVDDLAFVRPDGSEGMLGLSIHPMRDGSDALRGFIVVGADITGRKALENRLAQAQKLRSIGQLAAGIAHEINTPAQYVGDNIRFLQDAFAEIGAVLQGGSELLAAARDGTVGRELIDRLEEKAREADLAYLVSEIPLAIQHCLEGVERISRIVRAMKEFAHPGRDEKVPADLNRLIETTLTVARNEWKYVADMRTSFDPALPPLVCHPAEINQVILNLVVNAAQAIEEQVKRGLTAKGAITVTTRRLADRAEVRISDTGGGIPPEIQPRIFDPFFTTKDVGRGSGQGLAICHPVIVEKHKGSITFESEAGQGTTFTLTLPLTAREENP